MNKSLTNTRKDPKHWDRMVWANVIWAASWQNQQNDCALSEDLDQPGHPPGLIRVCLRSALIG